MNNDNLFLVKYAKMDGTTGFGLEDANAVRTLMNGSQAASLDSMLSAESNAPRATDIISALRQMATAPLDRASVTFQSPVDQQEIWAAGVTYKRSEEAREEESNNSNIYSRVYKAERPELFFKAMSYDVVGSNQPVGIRYDAKWTVPEPELVVMLNAHLEVIGFTIGNDMSSRDIEGANPLYLPQAKVYEGACAIGPRVWLQPGRTTWPELKIELQVERGGQIVFNGETSTAAIHRSLTELIDFLGRCKRFPRGVFLFSGVGIVPPDSFTLAEGDTIRIKIDPIGELVNTVHVVGNLQKEFAR